MPRFEDCVCVHHLDVAAEFHCQSCRLYYCERCVAHQFEGHGFVDRCRRCNSEVSACPRRPEAAPAALVARLGEIIRFVRTPGLVAILVGLALLVAPISWAIDHNFSGMLATLGSLIVGGIEVSVFFYLVNQCAVGNDRFELQGPDFRSSWDDIFDPLERLIAAFIPLVAVLVWAMVSIGDMSLAAMASSGIHLVAFAAAVLLLPLLIMLAAIGGGALDVLNPVSWARGLRLLGTRYWIALPIFFALLAAHAAWSALVATPLLALPFIGRVLGLLGGYYLMAMMAKLFGLLLEPHLASGR